MQCDLDMNMSGMSQSINIKLLFIYKYKDLLMELLRQRSSRIHTISQLSSYPSKNHVQATQGEGNCPSAIKV